MTRIFNFNPGPSALPLEILEEAAREMTDWRNTGMSILEISHRSAAYQEIHDETIELFRRLMKSPLRQKHPIHTGRRQSPICHGACQFSHKPAGRLYEYRSMGRKSHEGSRLLWRRI